MIRLWFPFFKVSLSLERSEGNLFVPRFLVLQRWSWRLLQRRKSARKRMEEFQNRRTIYLVKTSRWLVGCYEIPILVQTKWQQSGNQMSNFMFATRTRESIKSVVHSEVLLFLISIFCRHLQLFFLSLCIVDEYYPVSRVCNNKQWDQLFNCDFRWSTSD